MMRDSYLRPAIAAWIAIVLAVFGASALLG
jgi:hypothetical protein